MDVALRNVRLSFPNLWEAKAFGDSKPRFDANFLLDKKTDKDLIAELKAQCVKVAKEKFGDKAKSAKICLKDGEEKSYDGYEGCMFITAKSTVRPTVVDRDKTPLVADDQKPYAGCYVNASVSIYATEYQGMRYVSAGLNGVQFVRDGEPFGSAASDRDSLFEDISEETKEDVADESSDDDFFKDE